MMELLPGTEYSVDFLADRGSTIASVVRKGIKVVTSNMMECEVVDDDSIVKICEKVTALLKLHGNFGFDLKRDENGNIRIMEINPRLTGGVVACAAAGVNLPYYGVKLLLGETFQVPVIHSGVKMKRMIKEVFCDEKGGVIEL